MTTGDKVFFYKILPITAFRRVFTALDSIDAHYSEIFSLSQQQCIEKFVVHMWEKLGKYKNKTVQIMTGNIENV